SLLLSLEAEAAFRNGSAPSGQADSSMISALETVRRTGARSILHDGSDVLWSLAVSRDGDLLAAGSDNGTVRLWDLRARKRLAALTGPGRAVRTVGIDGDRLVAAGVDDGSIWLWHVRSGSRAGSLRAGTSPVAQLA